MTDYAFCPNCQALRPVTDASRCETCGGSIEGASRDHAGTLPPPTILYADDDRLLLSLCCDVLEREGYRTLIAPDGPSALEAARTARPDLILLDIMMPDMDGLEVCRRLRAMPELAGTPIVLLTASNDVRLDAQGREAGADLTLRKPFGPSLIVSTIQQLLGWPADPPARPPTAAQEP